jgi:hypothetical protein
VELTEYSISKNYNKPIFLGQKIYGGSEAAFEALANGDADFVGKMRRNFREFRMLTLVAGPNFSFGAFQNGVPRSYLFQKSCTIGTNVEGITISASLNINNFVQLRQKSGQQTIRVSTLSHYPASSLYTQLLFPVGNCRSWKL